MSSFPLFNQDTQMKKLLNGIRTVLYWFSLISMSVMLLITFGSVVTRYIFNFTFPWAEELSRYLFTWSVFIGSALIMGEHGHLAVEFIPNLVKGTIAGRILTIFIKLAGFTFVTILLVYGYKISKMMMYQMSPGLQIPMGIVYSVVPISSVLMLLYLIQDSIDIVNGKQVDSSNSEQGV